jgi:Zn-dependent protease
MQIPYERMTNDARRVIERAGRRAAERSAAQATPEHLLLALPDGEGSLVHQALTALGSLPSAIVGSLVQRLPPVGQRAAPAPLDRDSELVIHFATKEAYQLGHRQIDALHLLLGIFYLGRGIAHETLQGAGVQLVALRQYVLERPNVASGLAVARDEQLRHVLRPSPIFYGLLGLVALSGTMLGLDLPGRYSGPLTLLFIIGGWLVSLCVHECGHAIAAFLGGDHSVRDKGYLTLDPRRYTHPLLSIVLPLVFLILGGIGLPGGAVYINRAKLRNGKWEAFVSAAGPFGTLACIFLTIVPFLLPWHRWLTATNTDFWAALAYLAFVQVMSLVFNLLPIPGLDGFGIIAPGLPEGWHARTLRLGSLPLIVFYMVLWQDNPISSAFWYRIYDVADALRIPIVFVYMAMHNLPF